MIKFSSLAIIGTIGTIAAGISAPATAQIVGPPPSSPYDPPLYNYGPGYAPGPLLISPYSDHPAATGGGSYGYNVDTLRDTGD